MTIVAGKPSETEYGSYFGRYISLVSDPDVVKALQTQLESARVLLGTISEQTGDHRYEPGKWSIKELVGHVADTERVFAYRALRFARNDSTALPGFDENGFAANANFASLSLSEIVDEYTAVRQASIYLFKHLAGDAWNRRGVANKNEATVRAIAFMIAGHELHHINILKTRYFMTKV